MPEPVSFAEASAHLRLAGDTSEQALVESYITAARKWVENYTGHVLVQREVTETHPGFGRFFDLRWQPVQADTVTIAYTDSDGATGEVTDLTVNGRRVYPAYASWWPSTRLNTGVTLTYTAGYAPDEMVDDERAPFRQAILIKLTALYERRGLTDDEQRALDSFADQYRSDWL